MRILLLGLILLIFPVSAYAIADYDDVSGSLFECGWELGYGVLNLNPEDSTEGTWDSISESGTVEYRKVAGGFEVLNGIELRGGNGALNDNVALVTNNGGSYYNLSTGGSRVAFLVDAEAMTGDQTNIMRWVDQTDNAHMVAFVVDTAGALTLRVQCKLDGSTLTTIGADQSISLDTWYEVEARQIPGSDYFGWRMFDASGTQIYPGSGWAESSSMTHSLEIDSVELQSRRDAEIRFDAFVIDDAEIGAYIPPGALDTTPTISSVSGFTGTPGEVLSIAGEYLVTDDITYWLWPDNQGGFEGSTPSADGWSPTGGTWVVDGQNRNFYNNTTVLQGSQSFPADCFADYTCGPAEDPCRQAHSNRIYDTATGTDEEGYYSIYLRLSSDMVDVFNCINNYMKLTNMPAESVDYNMATSTWPTQGFQRWDGYSHYFNLPAQHQADRWYHFEWHYDDSEDIIEQWVDGKLVFHRDGSTECPQHEIIHTTTWTSTTTEVGIVNTDAVEDGCAFDITDGKSSWYDRVITSSSRVYPACTIVVGDSSDWDTCNKVYQYPVSLGNRTAEFEYRESGHYEDATGVTLTGSDRWLWVINNQQERSAAYQLTSSALIRGGTFLRATIQ